jgi:hypothetical protein
LRGDGCRVTAIEMRDKNLLWTGVVYFVGPLLLHVAWWQAVIFAFAMTACWYLSYCQRAVRLFGATLLFLGLCTWTGLLPAPDQWALFHR